MANQTLWEKSSDVLSRTIATVVMMVVPGLAGAWLDRSTGLSIFTLFGFLAGVVLGVVGLLYQLKRIQGEPIGRSGKRVRENGASEEPGQDSPDSEGRK